MPQGTFQPPLHPTAGSSAGPASDLRINITSDQHIFPSQEVLQSPVSEFPETFPPPPPPQGNTLETPIPNTENSSFVSSCSSSVHDDTSSTLSDSAESSSSLGGLNHVNDGVAGSTVQRKMSRVYSTDDLPQRKFSMDAARRPSATFADLQQLRQQQRPPNRKPSSSSLLGPANDEIISVGKESSYKPWLRKYIPAYGWLISPGYNLTDFPDDLIAGITISTVVIPQSMAYAMLAPLPPVYGLYTSVVPIFFYCIFGTSRHMHTGTFAITTLLLGQAVRSLIAQDKSSSSLVETLLYDTHLPRQPSFEDPEYEKRFIGMILMLSFVVGCVQVIMSFLRVGGWASKHLLPDALVGGFNTAAVFHIGTSQLKHFLGIKGMPSYQGAFALLKSWMWVGDHFLEETNWYTVALGTVAIVFMVIMRKLEQKRKAKHELMLRKKEMLMVQQRQAVSVAIVRNHEAQRQRRWEQQPFAVSPSINADSSNNSLRTVTDGNDATTVRPAVTFAPTVPTNLNDPERAIVMEEPPASTSVQDHDVYIPIPDILLAVIILTIVNVIFSLDTPRSNGGWGINVIGSIPKGLPLVTFPANLITSGPKEWLTLNFFVDTIVPMIQPALLIAVIIYVMSFSIAKQFGKRYGYKVDPNQEMLALGLASMGGSIFSGYACTGSLTRTAILSQSGAKTPLASMFGVLTVTTTLISLTWCFERVPNTVLAAIVLVALQSLVMQITEPFKLWRLGQQKAAIIWSVTFAGVMIISVELGVAIGIVVVILTTIYSWVTNRNNDEDEPLLGSRSQGRRRPSRRMSQASINDACQQQRRRDSRDVGDATESLLDNAAAAAAGSSGQQRGRGSGSNPRLSGALSPVSRGMDWKTRMLRTKWGQKVGSLFGMEQPIFSDPLHVNTDDDE
ncbi:hypothetical protein BGZ80_010752 [Entomortierella chlamydospora]|uniref:SLC26A/SulP transporter domain-containing protein n=1 Tax=Entomortierella chlamydospora TaxID=101097 RepID=A0A9P6SZM4_9FUNG|nr:hypothetical protein BGZ79_000906 [Entomortierella chlamydospora]KAG0013948.1 hypothetical protein BGZ80_010752 [Entomortierella chlamydospora]